MISFKAEFNVTLCVFLAFYSFFFLFRYFHRIILIFTVYFSHLIFDFSLSEISYSFTVSLSLLAKNFKLHLDIFRATLQPT